MIVSSRSGSVAEAAKVVSAVQGYSPFLPVNSFAGNQATTENVLGLTAFLGAGNMIANTIASMSLQVLDKTSPRGNQIVPATSGIPRLLQHTPNFDMTGFDLWHFVTLSLLFKGNAYLAKIRDSSGQIVELYPFKPDTVTPFRAENGSKMFRVRIYEGRSHIDRIYDSSVVHHVKGESFLGDPLVGDSVISLARHSLGAQVAQVEYQARSYGDGMLIKGALSTPEQNLTPDVAQQIKQQWKSTYSGVGASHDIAVLHSGVKFEPISLTPEDAQFIQTRKWGHTEIATLFGIPASRLNGETSTGTYQNQTQDDLVYYQQAVMPRVKRIEACLNNDPDLFGTTIASKWEPRFNEKDVLRSDIKTRYEVYEIARRIGSLSQNDIRDAEEMPTIGAAGDDYTPAGAGVNTGQNMGESNGA